MRRQFELLIGISAAVACFYLYILSVERMRTAVIDYCRPLGAVGVSLDKYAGAFCIMSNGDYVKVPMKVLRKS